MKKRLLVFFLIFLCSTLLFADYQKDSSGSDFASYVRYNGVHYTSDNIDEFFKQVDELKIIAK